MIAQCCNSDEKRLGLVTKWKKGEKAVVVGFAFYTFQNKNQITVFKRKLK